MRRHGNRSEGFAGDEQWLLIARNALNRDEINFFLCTARPDADLGEMLRAAFCRWHIEPLFRETKNKTGMDHYVGQTYRGRKRHLVLPSEPVNQPRMAP